MKSLTKAELAETNATTAELKRRKLYTHTSYVKRLIEPVDSTTRIEPGAKKMWKLSEVTDKL